MTKLDKAKVELEKAKKAVRAVEDKIAGALEKANTMMREREDLLQSIPDLEIERERRFRDEAAARSEVTRLQNEELAAVSDEIAEVEADDSE